MKTVAEEKIEDRISEIYDALINLAESQDRTPLERRREAVRLIDELKMAMRMLSHARPAPSSGNLSAVGEPSAAVAAYLRGRFSPATMDEIIDGVFAGGYMGGERKAHAFSVMWAVKNRLTGTGRHHPTLGLKGDAKGLIGLKDWDDSMFQP